MKSARLSDESERWQHLSGGVCSQPPFEQDRDRQERGSRGKKKAKREVAVQLN